MHNTPFGSTKFTGYDLILESIFLSKVKTEKKNRADLVGH